MSTDRELIWPLGTSGAALGARRIRDAVGLQDWVWLWNCGQGVKRWGWSKVCCILASASAAVLQRVTIHVHPFGPYGFGTGIATIWALRKIEGMLPSTVRDNVGMALGMDQFGIACAFGRSGGSSHKREWGSLEAAFVQEDLRQGTLKRIFV